MDLELLTLSVGQMKTNCYLLRDISTNKGIIIDPGDDAQYIGKVLKEKNIFPLFIVATHGHFDHLMAALELKMIYNIPLLINQKDEFLLSKMGQSARYYLQIDPGPAPIVDNYLKEGDQIKIGKDFLDVLETPGHTPGSVCFYSQKSHFLFTGDTLFARGTVGRTDFHYASKEDLHISLLKILKLPEETKIFPGHGIGSDIKTERKYF